MATRRVAPPPLHPLELSSADLRAMVLRTLDRSVAFLDSLPDQPLHRLEGAQKLARSLREPLPEAPTPFPRLLSLLFERVVPVSLNTASPGYFAYIPGGGLVHAAVADLITNLSNRYVGIWQAAPGLVEIESQVVRWLCEVVGLPAGCGGLLTSGGSMATLIAVVTARQERLGEALQGGVAYTSAHAHHSVHKALRFAGLPDAALRSVALDPQFRLSVDALRASIDQDRAAGLRPFLVVASAGTTATGAVDPLPEIAALCQREGLWLHVDAAYGGAFALTERGRRVLQGMEQADSVALDPHKGLFLPYGTGALLVADLGALRRCHGQRADYLPAPAADPDCWDFADLGPELSREPRGLRLWLPLKMHGAGAFRAALDEKLDLAQDAARRLGQLPGLRVLAGPELSLFAFRLDPPAGVDRDTWNHRVNTRVNSYQRVLITGAEVDGGYALRVCILSFRSHQDRVDMLVEDVARALQELGEEG
jgi:aromatic-L-amino-acid/L-tryptophan decarboxylase